MDSRTRTLAAFGRGAPDRTPIDFWASRGFREKLSRELDQSYEEFLDAHDVDFRYIAGPRYIGPPLATGGDGASVDLWGVPRVTVEVPCAGGTETYSEVAAFPLAQAESESDVHSYAHWPSPDWYDYSVVEAQCDAVLRQGRIVAFMGDRLNRISQLKPAMYLCGIDTILMHMALVPDLAHAVFAQIRAFYESYTERILAAANGKIDIVVTGDDFGTQRSLFVSCDMWREFLDEGFRSYVRRIKKAGAKVMHHSCGAVEPLIPLLLDAGLDILQSLQPEAEGMNPALLKARYGDRLCFHGGVSIQQTLPQGTRSEVRAEVAELARVFGADGGYVFCTAHNVQADTPVANVLELLNAYREYGAR